MELRSEESWAVGAWAERTWEGADFSRPAKGQRTIGLQPLRSGCPLSRVFCEKWGFTNTLNEINSPSPSHSTRARLHAPRAHHRSDDPVDPHHDGSTPGS